MRKRFGVGTPRGLQGRLAALIVACAALVDVISDLLTVPDVHLTLRSARTSTQAGSRRLWSRMSKPTSTTGCQGSQLLTGAGLAAKWDRPALVCQGPDGTAHVLDGIAGAEKAEGRPPHDGKVDGLETEHELVADIQDESTSQIIRWEAAGSVEGQAVDFD
jgi:hypothetical protein